MVSIDNVSIQKNPDLLQQLNQLQSEIESIKEKLIKERITQCACCLKNISPEEASSTQLRSCGHAFHDKCITPIIPSSSCPKCEQTDVVYKETYNNKEKKQANQAPSGGISEFEIPRNLQPAPFHYQLINGTLRICEIDQTPPRTYVPDSTA